MAVAIALVLIVVGSVAFHVLSPWWWTPIASNWHYVDDTLIVTFWITGIAFAAIVLFMAHCVFRYRHREGGRASYLDATNWRHIGKVGAVWPVDAANLRGSSSIMRLLHASIVWFALLGLPACADTTEYGSLLQTPSSASSAQTRQARGHAQRVRSLHDLEEVGCSTTPPLRP